MSFARVLMNRCNQVDKNKNEKERGQVHELGVRTAPTKIEIFSDTLKIGILIYKYKKVDATFSLMMKATACPNQLRFMASASPCMFGKG